MKLIGRLFRSRDTNVRESELVVFISPEIVGYADEPRVRQQMVADTVRCRLDQIPEAEGCPPCCRRLPPDAIVLPGEPAFDDPGSVGGAGELGPTEALPPPQLDDMPPLSASQIPSANGHSRAAGGRGPMVFQAPPQPGLSAAAGTYRPRQQPIVAGRSESTVVR
jgi:hypothetical protein